MVRHRDRPLRIVRVSFETTRFSAQHLVDTYAYLVPRVRRTRLTPRRDKIRLPQVRSMTAKRRRGET
jgi:hypothetical protein